MDASPFFCTAGSEKNIPSSFTEGRKAASLQPATCRSSYLQIHQLLAQRSAQVVIICPNVVESLCCNILHMLRS